MQQYSDVVLVINVPGGQARVPAVASVQVNINGGGAATLYSDNGVTARANPIVTDSSGEYSFYAADGLYDLVISVSGFTTETKTAAVRLFDGSASSGSAAIGFIQAGAGAVARTGQAKMREIVSVKDFGAVGDNVADDTAEIQAAADALGATGGFLYFPKGTYKISSEITFTAPVVVVGAGIESTVIRQTGATANGLNFNYSSLLAGGGVRDITIEAGAGYKTGGLTASGSTGIGIKVKKANDNFSCGDVSVNNFDTGINLVHCWNTNWRAFRVLFCTTDGIRINLDGTDIGGGNKFAQGKVSNFGFTGTNTASSGIRIKASGGEEFSQTDITGFNVGVKVDPSTGSEQVLYLFFDSVLADTCVADGWLFDGSASKNLWSIQCSNCWASFCSGPGVRVKGANVDSIRWVGGRIRENEGHGIHIESGVINFGIVGGEITSNSRGAVGVKHGVQIDAGVSEWDVIACRIGNHAAGTDTQQNGVNIASGASAQFRVVDNDLRGNLNTPISNGSSVLTYQICGNLPIQTAGSNATQVQSWSGGTPVTVAAGATVYLGSAGASAFSDDQPFLPGRPSIITNLYVAVGAAPGAGQTFTYTVQVNAIDSTMTGAISGAASFSLDTSANPKIINPTDYVSIKLVTSAGAAVTKHRFFMNVAQ